MIGWSRQRLLGRHSLALPTAIALGLFGCGGGSTAPISVNGGGGSFSASVDGVAWTADASTAEARHSEPGKYVLSGTKIAGEASLALEIDLYNIAAPGTYPLGVGEKVFGGAGWVVSPLTSPPKYWLTPLSGAAGTVTVSSVSNTRIAGSFSYNAPAYTITGDATGTRTVTNGTFDLPVRTTGNPGPVAANAGGKMSATINGTPWNAANVTYNKASTGVQFSGDNTSHLIGINLAGVTGTGTFNLGSSPLRIINAGGPSTNPTTVNCCWGGTLSTSGALNDAGSVTITTFTATRIAGTFTATLAPVPNTVAQGQMTVANGSFDIGIP
jgi:hypothetical protein